MAYERRVRSSEESCGISVIVFVFDNVLFTSPILLLAVEAALVFLECLLILDVCGLVGEVTGVAFTWPSAVLFMPVGAIERFGRAAEVVVKGCAEAASCES
jgi:hypothetical protein